MEFENHVLSENVGKEIILKTGFTKVVTERYNHDDLTVEPRFNEVPRDWANWFVISRVRYIENLVITNFLENNLSVRYNEV